MDELSPIETRSRSRSRTPFLRSSCDRETCLHAGDDDDHHHHHHNKNSPLGKKHKQIAAIIEEELDNRPQTPTKRSYKSVTKISSTRTTSDYSSNSSEDLSTNADNTPTPSESTKTIYERKNNNKNQEISEGRTSSSTVVTTRISKSYATNGRPSTLVNKRLNKTKEVLQNESNTEFEENAKIKTSTPILSSQTSNRKQQKVIEDESFNISDENHPAYQEYIRAGEYWKKYPKTDYTYSKLSPHRREIAPGVVAFPNMSRKSLDKYQQRVYNMIQRNPGQEESIRQRFVQTLFTRTPKNQHIQETNHYLYDSQDENDYNDHNSYVTERRESIFKRFFTSIVSIFYYITHIFSRENHEKRNNMSHLYRTGIHQEENRGLLSRTGNSIKSFFYSIFEYIYFGITKVLYWDVCLLRSSNQERKGRKLFLLLLLMLLPFLLLAAWNCADERDQLMYIQRFQSFIPSLTLLGIRNAFHNFSSGFPSFLQSIKYSHNNNYASITNNIKKSLSPEEFENLINHINIYVQKTVDTQLNHERQKRDTTIPPELAAFLANAVREQISLHNIEINQHHGVESYQLTDNDIQRIIARLKMHLATISYPGPIILSKENLDEIINLIHHKIEINNQNFNIIEKIDFGDLLIKILGSPKLAEFVDSRILLMQSKIEDIVQPKLEAGLLMSKKQNEMLYGQQKIIDDLNAEISFIKTNLAEKLNENNDLHFSITSLQNAQNEITERLKQHELNVNGRFDNLLLDIEERLTKMNQQQFDSINRQIKINLIEILGYSMNKDNEGGINLDEIDLKNWIRNMFVAKAVLEDRLNELSAKIDGNIKEEVEKSSGILFKDISDKLRAEILKIVEYRQKSSISKTNVNVYKNGGNTDLNEREIRKIVKDVLAIYDADKTGMVDYALESAGGQVLSTRCTENYQIKSAQITLFGFPLWYPSNTPRIAITPSVNPGECWAFQGFPGFLVLKLNTMIHVSGFSLEHIPKSLAPTGTIDSAPKNFTVLGLDKENDEEPVLFGEYEYIEDGPPIQFFPVQNKNINRPFDIVELRIETNHGNLAYTCLYRFRVHGKTSIT